jgi:hypothetical protein
MYLDILNDDMVGFANITASEILTHLFLTYGNITSVEFKNNFEQMRKVCDPQQPVKPYSSRSKIVLDFLRQDAWKLAIRGKSRWSPPRSLPQTLS